jgi:hypothetical protein
MDLAQIRARAEAAASVIQLARDVPYRFARDWDPEYGSIRDGIAEALAALDALGDAREDIPDLLDRVEALETALTEIAGVFPPGSLILNERGCAEVPERQAGDIRHALGEVGL